MHVKLADANTTARLRLRRERLRATGRRSSRACAPSGARIADDRGGARARPSTCASTSTATSSARRPGRGRARHRGALARPLARDHQGPRRRRDGLGRATGSDRFSGTHAIGHARMATESDVDISNAHPYWAYPFSDVAVVHNGQLTNYHDWRRRLERAGHRFQSECDSEIIAVYLAERMAEGVSLEDAMRQSLEEPRRRLHLHLRHRGRARAWPRTSCAAKPLVLYESDDIVALASEEIAIRTDHRPRDRHLRPLRGRGDGVDRDLSPRPSTRAASSSSTARVPRIGRDRRRARGPRRREPHHPQDQRRAALADLRARASAT